MNNRVKKIVATAAVAGLAVVGMDAATYAGSGDSLILGKLNKSHKTTNVSSTGKGPALSLHAKGNRPALAVDSKAKILKLNADRVDGKDAKALQNNVRVYTLKSGDMPSGNLSFRLPRFPAGRYQVSYDVLMHGAVGSPSAPVGGFCHLIRNSSPVVFAGYEQATAITHGDLGMSASDVLVNKRPARWSLMCYSDVDWIILPEMPVRVTLTRIDKTIGGDLSVTTPRERP